MSVQGRAGQGDRRDRLVMVMVAVAGLVEIGGLLVNLLTDPEMATHRTSALSSSGLQLAVRAGFFAWAVVALAGERRQVGRALAAALGLRAALDLVMGGLLTATATAAWSFGWLTVALVLTDLLLLAALGLVVAVWQDRGLPALGRSSGVIGTVALVGATVAVVAAGLPPLTSGPVWDLAGPLRRSAGFAFGFGLNALLSLAIVWLAVRLDDTRAGRALLLLIALIGLASGVGALVSLAVSGAGGIRPTLWLGLAVAGNLAVLAAAFRLGDRRGERAAAGPAYTSSDTA